MESIVSAKTNDDSWEVIVVDNASSPEYVRILKTMAKEKPFVSFVSFIFHKRNDGFAKGNNIGIKRARGEYILLLNSDTVIQQGAIQKTLAVFSDPTVGAATCKLVFPSGKIDPACHRGFPTPWAAFTYIIGLERLFPRSRLFSQYHQYYKDLSKTHEIDVPSGAFFLIRRRVINEIGFLDEDFFMYGEDIDWAYRIKQRQYKILFVPNCVVIHKKKQSGRESVDKAIKRKADRSFYETMKLFYQKHYKDRYPRVMMWIIFFIIDMRIKMV